LIAVGFQSFCVCRFIPFATFLAAMSDYIPPLFKNFGKSVIDLFKEQFDYKRQLKLKSTTANGVQLESGAELGKDGRVDGNVKATYKQAGVGTFQSELNTTGSTKVSVKADKLTPGLAMKLTGDEKPSAKLEVDYAKDFFSSSLTVDASKVSTSVDVAGVIGFDGLAVGGHAKYDVLQQKLADFNAGAEYAQSDFTVTVKTSDQANKITTSYLHHISPLVQVAASLDYDIERHARTATIGSTYKLDFDNSTKVKLLTSGVFAAVFEHRLQTNGKIVLSGESSLKASSAVPEKFGVSLHLGDE